MAITIRFTGETSKMSWVALPVEPAYMGRRSGKARRPLMPVGLAKIILEEVIIYQFTPLAENCNQLSQ